MCQRSYSLLIFGLQSKQHSLPTPLDHVSLVINQGFENNFNGTTFHHPFSVKNNNQMTQDLTHVILRDPQ